MAKFRLDKWVEWRQRARTDPIFLATKLLHYQDIDQEVHGPIASKLQQFKGGTDIVTPEGLFISYTPSVDIQNLEGTRNRLFLDPRGHLKTTFITITHSIQWILNYPDIRILVSTATGELSQRIVNEMRAHFQYNEVFRFIFPDFCPKPKRATEFGNMESFTVPNRQKKWLKEPTVSTCTVGKVIAGGHYDVIKNSDLVDKENVSTPNQIEAVKNHLRYMQPLLERYEAPPYHGWMDIEGTPYDFSDAYNEKLDLVKAQEENGVEPTWQVHVRSAEIDSDKKLTLWSKKFPWSELQAIRQEMGDELYSAQYLCNPVPSKGGLADINSLIFVPRRILNELMPKFRKHATIDLAGMEASETNDYTVITTSGFDRDGRMYVINMRRGHFTPFEVIGEIFDVAARLNPLDFRIEKDAHARVLLPFFARECEKRGRYPIMTPIKRDNRTSKQQRIRGLQPWFRSGIIRFAEDLPCKLDLIQEIARFPKYSHDDILDTLADQMYNREGGASYDVYPDPIREGIPGKPSWERDNFLGFEPDTGRALWVAGEPSQMSTFYDKVTGF